MSRWTRRPRHIARPVSVGIRTIGEDPVAWDRARGIRHLLSNTYAAVLAAIPTTWVLEEEFICSLPGDADANARIIDELLQAGLIVQRI